MAISLDGDAVVAKFHQVNVRFEPAALKIFDAYRQRGWFKREAGGQLFAEIRGDVWHVVAATGPRAADRRGRFHFWPDRKAEQREIDQHFSAGLEYIGDWHTHPEQVPTPSRDDIISIKNVVRESTLHTPGLLLCIVGLATFPTGLYVSFHG